MTRILIGFLSLMLVSSVFASVDKKRFDSNLESLRKIVDVRFDAMMTFKEKAHGVKNLKDLIEGSRSYFGVIIKKVVITNNPNDELEKKSLRGTTLLYKYDGSEDSILRKWKFKAFYEIQKGIYVQQEYLKTFHHNVKFVRGSSYQRPARNTDYSLFLYEMTKVVKSILANPETAGNLEELDELIINDTDEVLDNTNMIYQTYQGYPNRDKTKTVLTVEYKSKWNKLENSMTLYPLLTGLANITLVHGFRTLSYIEPEEDFYYTAVNNLSQVLDEGYAERIHELKLRRFYINSNWDEIDDYSNSRDTMVIGVTKEDIIEAIETYFL